MKKASPIDFYVYAGNASEFKTMAASIESLKQKYNVKESIVVADRGLNSAANLKMLQSNDLGFLMAQKVSNLDQKTTKAMFDLRVMFRSSNKESKSPASRSSKTGLRKESARLKILNALSSDL